MSLLSVTNLSVTFRQDGRSIPAVRGVSFEIQPGETVALVGESGSGKSVTALATVGLLPDSAAIEGSVTFNGTQMIGASETSLRQVRGNDISFIFQEPMTSLNPLHTVEKQILESLALHQKIEGAPARARVLELLEKVGIRDGETRLRSYPHQLSGGQRQRVMIAMALANEPKLLVADEPTTALDVTIQAQILEVVADLQHRLGTAVVWISHDLGVVGGIADRIAVLYGGHVVETGDMHDIFGDHRHPYTAGLLASRPRLGHRAGDLAMIPGSPPDPRHLPSGCVFYDRCTVRSDDRCATERPPLVEPAGAAPGHLVRSFCAEHDASTQIVGATS